MMETLMKLEKMEVADAISKALPYNEIWDIQFRSRILASVMSYRFKKVDTEYILEKHPTCELSDIYIYMEEGYIFIAGLQLPLGDQVRINGMDLRSAIVSKVFNMN